MSEIEEGNAQAYRRDVEVRSLLHEYHDERRRGEAAYGHGDSDAGWVAIEHADLLKRELYARDYIVRD